MLRSTADISPPWEGAGEVFVEGFLFLPKIKALSTRDFVIFVVFRRGLDADVSATAATRLHGRTAGEKRVHVLCGEDFTLGADVRPSVLGLFFLFFHVAMF